MSKESVKQAEILTEDELQEVGNLINDLHYSRQISDQLHTEVENLILSHSSLLSANAELSFKNMLLKAAYNKLLKETNSCTTQ